MLALLRRGPRTVEELASSLRVTDNAIRLHLSSLERDGLIRQDGVRRSAGAGKPAVIFEIHPDAELLFSRAYAPVLVGLLDELSADLSAQKNAELMRALGRRLASASAISDTPSLQVAAEKCVALLQSLGGEPEILPSGNELLVQSTTACPLALAVAKNPDLCKVFETLFTEITHSVVTTKCDHGERPRCRFGVAASGSK